MEEQSFTIRFAALQLASLLCIGVCAAGPATSDNLVLAMQQQQPRTPQPRASGLADSLMQSAFRTKNADLTARPKLDLRMPESAKPPEGYPSEPARNGAGNPNSAGFQLAFGKSRSPAEELVNRVHHEGLPLARLWENKAALVSIGLNQKGQAGLWLIQKTQ